MLNKIQKIIYVFKSINHFPQTTDAFDHLLNDAINRHVQAIDHHRNLAGAGIQQRSVTTAGFRPPLSESGQSRFQRPELSNFSHLAGILLEWLDFGAKF